MVEIVSRSSTSSSNVRSRLSRLTNLKCCAFTNQTGLHVRTRTFHVVGEESKKEELRSRIKAAIDRKLENIAEGAARMTGCDVKFTKGAELFDMRPSYVIGKAYQKN
ncbi:hypothetical protein BH23CHL2_BH23CHL2_32380 [soil metagenome]